MRGLGLGLGIIRQRGSLDVDATAWRDRVVVAGGTVSQSTLSAASALVKTLKAASIWSRVSRLNLFAGDQLTACLVPLIVGAGSATDTNVNFVSGDYTEATGLSGDGTTKYLNTGWAGYGLTGGMSVYIRTITDATVGRWMGANNAAAAESYMIGKGATNNHSVRWGGSTVASQTAATPVGFYHGIRAASNDLKLYRSATQLVTVGSVVTPVAITESAYVFCVNNAGTAATFTPTGNKFAGYAIDDGTMSVSDETTWHNAWQTFQTALGRNV